MTLNDIVALAKAGFTSEQIAKLAAVPATPAPAAPAAPAPVAAPAPAPAPAPVAAPAPAPVAAPAPAPAQTFPMEDPTLAAILGSIKELNTTIQAGAIMDSKQINPPTADEILANIINPPIKN